MPLATRWRSLQLPSIRDWKDLRRPRSCSTSPSPTICSYSVSRSWLTARWRGNGRSERVFASYCPYYTGFVNVFYEYIMCIKWLVWLTKKNYRCYTSERLRWRLIRCCSESRYCCGCHRAPVSRSWHECLLLRQSIKTAVAFVLDGALVKINVGLCCGLHVRSRDGIDQWNVFFYLSTSSEVRPETKQVFFFKPSFNVAQLQCKWIKR